MFNIIKEILISENFVIKINYERLVESNGLDKKQFDRFWWHDVFDNWLYDKNR